MSNHKGEATFHGATEAKANLLATAMREALEAQHASGMVAGAAVRCIVDPCVTEEDLATIQDSRDAAQVRAETATREAWRVFYDVMADLG